MVLVFGRVPTEKWKWRRKEVLSQSSIHDGFWWLVAMGGVEVEIQPNPLLSLTMMTFWFLLLLISFVGKSVVRIERWHFLAFPYPKQEVPGEDWKRGNLLAFMCGHKWGSGEDRKRALFSLRIHQALLAPWLLKILLFTFLLLKREELIIEMFNCESSFHLLCFVLFERQDNSSFEVKNICTCVSWVMDTVTRVLELLTNDLVGLKH